jgi:hypothetical protein
VAVSNGNISALYRAVDLRAVLRAAGALCEPGRVWCLTWPTVADRQILVTESTGEPVDLLIGTQIEQLQPPGDVSDAFGNWCRRVVGALGGQFSWLAETSATAAALRGESPMAVVGITGSGEDGIMLATEIAHAIERVAILESALQEGVIYRHLLAGCDEALLVIHESGRIVSCFRIAGMRAASALKLPTVHNWWRGPHFRCNATHSTPRVVNYSVHGSEGE